MATPVPSLKRLLAIAMAVLLGAFLTIWLLVALLSGPQRPADDFGDAFEPAASISLGVPDPVPEEPEPVEEPDDREQQPGHPAASPPRLGLQARPDETATGRIVLRNAGETPLRLIDLYIVGDGSLGFEDLDCGPDRDLAAGQRCEVAVRFSPLAPGSVSGSLIVVHDGPDGRLAVTLDGQAHAPPARPAIPPAPSRDVEAELRALLLAERATDAGPGIMASGIPDSRVTSGDGYVVRRPDPPRLSQADYGESFPRRVASYPVDLTRTITADMVIPAVLAVPVNSQQPGQVTAVVESHVYGRTGRLVLIPAGSTVIGEYVGLARGETRLPIAWSRIIRPDGAHVLIDDIGYDAMGRSGVPGQIDRREVQRFAQAGLVSLISGGAQLGVALAAEALTGGAGSIVVSNGQVIRQESPVQQAARDSTGRFGRDMEQIVRALIEEGFDTNPIITVPAGTRMLLRPREDLWLPSPEAGAHGGMARLSVRPSQRPAGGNGTGSDDRPDVGIAQQPGSGRPPATREPTPSATGGGLPPPDSYGGAAPAALGPQRNY